MQRLHAAVHDFRKSGDLRNIRHGKSGIAQCRGRAAGGDQLDCHDRRARAQNPASPVLSETEISARLICRLLMLSVMPLSAEQPHDKGKNCADQKRGYDREIKTEIAPLDHDVAGQPAQSETGEQGQASPAISRIAPATIRSVRMPIPRPRRNAPQCRSIAFHRRSKFCMF